jgi:hypothetical protein
MWWKLSPNVLVALEVLGIVFSIIGCFVALAQVPDSTWWRDPLLRGSVLLIIACILSIVATSSNNGKWFAIGAIVALFVSIFIFLSLPQFGYAFNKLESPGSSNISIKITYPSENNNVVHPQQVAGKFSGKLSEGRHAWLLASLVSYSDRPGDRPYRWWEPLGEIIPDKDSWEVTAYIGAAGADIETGNKYEIAAVLVNEEWHDYFNYYKQNAKDSTFWWTVPLPIEFPIKDKIEVIRK